MPARVLPAWDEHLLGWKDRSFLMPAAVERLCRGGLIGPAATIDGLALGKWGKRKGEPVMLEPFGRVSKPDAAALERAAAALADYA